MTINVFGGGNTGGPAFPVQRSVRLRSSASAYFNRTPASASNRKTWTYSGWVKRGKLGADQFLLSANIDPSLTTLLRFTSGDVIRLYTYAGAATQTFDTTAVFRDPSAWYHVVAIHDTTQATATDRLQVWVNGVRQAGTTTGTVSQNSDGYVNAAVLHNIGQWTNGGSNYLDGYLTEINFVNGQALTPSSFGSYNSTTGVWQPIKYSGTYGTNGFYLNFQDNSNNTATTIGKDSSGNGNNWTPNGINVSAYTGTPPNNTSYDSMLDVPTLTSATNANFCLLNQLRKGTGATLSEANLTWSITLNNAVAGTIGVSSGKWYWEVTAGSRTYVGIVNEAASIQNQLAGINGGFCYAFSGLIYSNGGTSSSYGATYTSGDIIGAALDMDAGTLTFYKNGVSQGVAFTGLSGIYFPATGSDSVSTATGSINFGQRPFSYSLAGFKSLNTYNLPAPTIPNGATQFAATLYTGNGTSQTITNGGNNTLGKTFQPDFVWGKNRSTATSNVLVDSVRGATIFLQSNSTAAEATNAQVVSAFTSTGFSLGNDATLNGSTNLEVAWQWKGGGTAVTNTSGSITSSVSANPSAGFSIVTYTGNGTAGATVGHGLGVAPSFIIVKCRNTAGLNWPVYHPTVGASQSIYLDLTNAAAATTTLWNAVNPSSSVFTLGTSGYVNGNTQTYVAYCWAQVAGYSKFGSYTGNGSTDGVFVYLGFRPRWILYKATGTADAWQIYDTSRNTSNATDLALFPYATTVETDTTSLSREMDILSNGFKIRGSDAQINTNAATYIYAAFAESPFNYSLAR